MKIDKPLLITGIDGYSDEGMAQKIAFHKSGKRFLKELAAELSLEPGSFDVRSNLGGVAVSGEVTLHADKIYIQLSEGFGRGISILYRSCAGRRDCCGGANNFTSIYDLDQFGQERFVKACRDIVAIPGVANTAVRMRHKP